MTLSTSLAAMEMALDDFIIQPAHAGWASLPFFRDGAAHRIAQTIDARISAGAHILPPPPLVFTALSLTPLEYVRVVILGQDPYPNPGDAHGLAFSYNGTRRLPASLNTILKEAAANLEHPPLAAHGNLEGWARQGVLLLNTALTVEAGKAGAHLNLGWDRLVDEAIRAVSSTRPHAVFLLWGKKARDRSGLIDRTKHFVLESGHPSPLNRLRDFEGSRPFSQANQWLMEKGMGEIAW